MKDDMITEQIINETCVSCNIVTEVLVNEPVTMRHHYVEGAGQLCKTCYDKVYS